MYKILSAGTSFNWGLGLHFYDRVNKNLLLDFKLSEEELQFNKNNSFHSLLANKLNVESEIFKRYSYENLPSILECLEGLKSEILRNTTKIKVASTDSFTKILLDNHKIPFKIVILQFFNLEKDFFIYNGQIYKLDLMGLSTFLDSKNNLINSIDETIRIDFSKKLHEDIHLWTWNREKWRKEHASFFIDKFNEINDYFRNQGIIFKIISYMDDLSLFKNQFNENLYVDIIKGNKIYNCIYNLVKSEKLMIKDDLGAFTQDEHPNFEAHKIVAESLYNNIIKDSLYNKL